MPKGLAIEITSPDMIRLSKVFQKLAYEDQREVLLDAFEKATRPTVMAVKANAPVRSGGTGNLRKSIGLLVAKNEIAVIIAARRNKGYKGWHAHLVEFGTRQRSYVTKNGNEHRTGRMDYLKPYGGFFNRGIDATQPIVMKRLGDEFMSAIDRFHREHGIK